MGWDRGAPIDRRYIEQFLTAHSSLIRGAALEVAETRYTRALGAQVDSHSILAPHADIAKTERNARLVVADLTRHETLPASAFDTFVCTQTLNFIYDFRVAIGGAKRLLAPSGAFVGTVSGYCQVSRYDADRWGDWFRFSEAALKRALSEAFDGEIVTESFGNALAAQAMIQGLAVEDMPDPSLLDEKDPDYPIIIGFVART